MFIRTTDSSAAKSLTTAMPRHNWWQTVTLHVLPGVPLAAVFFGVGYLTRDVPGWPAFYTLVIMAGLVEFPFLILLTRYMVWRERRAGLLPESGEGIPYRAKQPGWVWALALVAVFLAAGLNVAATPILTAPFEGLQNGLPGWAVLNFDPRTFGAAYIASPALFIVMWCLSLPALMLAGGIAQEYYFRGYLLPRMPKSGIAQPILNALLFSIFHLTSPWGIVARLPYVILFSLFAFWRRSLNVAIVIHAGMGIALFALSSVFLYIGISRALG